MKFTEMTYFQRLTNFEKLAVYFSLFMLVGLLTLSSFHKMGGYGVETDFYWAYAPDAQRLLNGEMPQEPGVGPGYALTLAFFNLIVGDWFTTGKIVSILSAVLCGFFTFKLVRDLFNERVAFFTLILWHVTVLPWSIVAGTDMFFAFLVAVSMYFLFRGGEVTASNLLLAGLFVGLAYLTRHNAIVLPIGVAIVVLFLNPESWPVNLRLKRLAIFLTAFVAINLPWVLLQYFDSGTPVRSDSYLIIASHFYGRPGVVSSEDMRLAAQKFDSLWSVVFYDFGHFVKHYLLNIYHHFYDFLINSLKFPSFLFVAAGLLVLLPRMSKKQVALFVFPVLSFLLLCLVHYEPRYYLYLISFFIIPITYFLFQNEESHDRSGLVIAKYLRQIAFGMTVLFLLAFSAKEVKRTIQDEPRELLEMANGLRNKVESGSGLIARKPHLGFLTGLKTVYFPEVDSLSDLLAYAASENADYILYGEIEAKRRPELRALLQPENVSEQLEPIYVWDDPLTVVYKIKSHLTSNTPGDEQNIGFQTW